MHSSGLQTQARIWTTQSRNVSSYRLRTQRKTVVSKVRALIVDNEPLARDHLRIWLGEVKDITIVDECKNGLEAIEVIQRLRPDLVFLALDMPRFGGLDVLKWLKPNELPGFVFVTAQDHAMLEALKTNGLDYLQKPFDTAGLLLALSGIKKNMRERTASDYRNRLLEMLNQISEANGLESKTSDTASYSDSLQVKVTGGGHFIPVEDIEYVRTAGNKVSLRTTTGTFVMRISMSELEAQLDPEQFIRIHRSTMVNVGCIRELRRYSRGDYMCFLRDATRLRFSRFYRERLELQLNSCS